MHLRECKLARSVFLFPSEQIARLQSFSVAFWKTHCLPSTQSSEFLRNPGTSNDIHFTPGCACEHFFSEFLCSECISFLSAHTLASCHNQKMTCDHLHTEMEKSPACGECIMDLEPPEVAEAGLDKSLCRFAVHSDVGGC